MILYHFTCDHGHKGLTEEGHTFPVPQPLLGDTELSWFTTNPKGEGAALDMPAILDCDRLEHRFRVTEIGGNNTPHISADRSRFELEPNAPTHHQPGPCLPELLRPWIGSPEQATMPPEVQRFFHRSGNPSEWYISSEPVPVEYDPT